MIILSPLRCQMPHRWVPPPPPKEGEKEEHTLDLIPGRTRRRSRATDLTDIIEET